MTNISKYHSVKVISAVMGFIVLSELAVAQDMGKNDSVSVRTEKTDMPYKVKGRIIDAVTKKGFAGARVTTPNLNVSAMTDENGNYEIGLPDLSVALYVEAPGYSRQVVPVKGRNEVNVSLFTVSGHAYYDDGMSVSDGEAVVDGFTSGTLSMTDDMTSLLNGQVRAISHSGDPGSSSSFFIRGYNSVNLSAQPLFVVDGVIWQMQDQVASAVDNYYNNPLTLLDPSDIEKVTILKNGLHIWEDNVIVEIVDPVTLQPVPEGEVGELVLTTINREAMPLLRYRTRDLTCILPGDCPCGRTHKRLARFKGRSDDMIILKGVNLFPIQIEKILMQFKELGSNYLITLETIGNSDEMLIEVELSDLFTDDYSALQRLTKGITRQLKDELLLTPRIKLVAKGSLPTTDGKAVRVKDHRKLC